MTKERAIELCERLPVVLDWVMYKGDHVVVDANIEATQRAGKPMVDVFYCMTKALNNVALYTVQWDKGKFEPSHLSNTKWRDQ